MRWEIQKKDQRSDNVCALAKETLPKRSFYTNVTVRKVIIIILYYFTNEQFVGFRRTLLISFGRHTAMVQATNNTFVFCWKHWTKYQQIFEISFIYIRHILLRIKFYCNSVIKKKITNCQNEISVYNLIYFTLKILRLLEDAIL